ncbi:MAG: hypothetical protein IH934_05780 [Nanoarchaeota archaeon]|nr:hypothetical protein [Nanoarchaeota archaeon]
MANKYMVIGFDQGNGMLAVYDPDIESSKTLLTELTEKGRMFKVLYDGSNSSLANLILANSAVSGYRPSEKTVEQHGNAGLEFEIYRALSDFLSGIDNE